MFTLYRINYQSAPKTISDSSSVHTWPNWSGTIFVTIIAWNASIPKVFRSISDSFLERSAIVNGLVSEWTLFLEQNLVITLLDWRLDFFCQTYANMEHIDPVQCEKLNSGPVWYSAIWFPRALFTLYRIDFWTGPKISWYSVNIASL